MAASAFDPATTYVHLHGGEAERLVVDENFWPAVISGERPLGGWLGGLFDYVPPGPGEPATTHSESHPNGEELHVCMSGAVTIVLEHDNGDEQIELRPGRAFVIPKGVWHRLEASEPSQVFTLTFGEGTEHRPSR